MEKRNEISTGILYAVASNFLWGLLPIYWKLLKNVDSLEVLANRVFWSFLFMIVLLLFTRKWGEFKLTFKSIVKSKKELVSLLMASLFISINWFIYIWSVSHNHIIEASLGYYINPLVSVLLGIIILKEKTSPAQIVSFIIACIGVLVVAISYGKIPVISLALAFSFGLYSLVKKMIKVDTSIGLTLETMVVTPIAFIYIVHLFVKGNNSLMNGSLVTDLLLIFAGVATAIPLLYFAKGAHRIPLTMLGYIQYISPSISLILGIFLFDEHFSKAHFISFLFIWLALVVYSLSQTKLIMNENQKWLRKKDIEV